MKKKVTSQDIADKLGLSRNTVSKALNNHTSIAETTRKLIIKNAVDMGYKRVKCRPWMNENNNFIKTGNIVAVTHEQFVDPSFWAFVSRGMVDSLSKSGYNLIFHYVKKNDEEYRIIPQSISSSNVDGIIILGSLKVDYLKEILKTGFPTVYVDAAIDLFGAGFMRDTILMENQASVYQITRSLIQQGHTKLGFIGDIGFCKSYQERWLGFKTAMEDAKINVNQQYCMIEKSADHYQTYEDVSAHLAKKPQLPTAFVCANDRTAIYVIKMLREKGINTPVDIAVSGFDDIFEATVVEPHLTTVRINKEEIGRRAAEELLWRILNPDRPFEIIHIATEVIFRDSTLKKITTLS
ncbi:MAG TPA: LacI family DNA-binding transcriptional regulator [Bacillota bacterium]|nr:LacI family DNA-binding transcriptional regulator [Bacillota bacterium]